MWVERVLGKRRIERDGVGVNGGERGVSEGVGRVSVCV